ncbi:31151_t:CDS:2, partial [Gigaspora margarita]
MQEHWDRDCFRPKTDFGYARIIQKFWKSFKEKELSNARLAWNNLANDGTSNDEKFLTLIPHKIKNPVSLNRIKMHLNKEYTKYIKKYNRYPYNAKFEITSDKQAPWFEPVTFSMIRPEELPDISAIKKTGRRIVMIFDDLASEPIAIQQKIEEFFRSSRHSNISPIYIAQYYFETSMKIHANLIHILLHHGGGGSLDNIKRILRSKYDNYKFLARKIDS